jgi:hypothetical protein
MATVKKFAYSSVSPYSEVLGRVRAEFMEMPGLQLTARQAQCLFGLDPATCDAVLADLQDAKFLTRTQKGLFAMAEIRLVSIGRSGKLAGSY